MRSVRAVSRSLRVRATRRSSLACIRPPFPATLPGIVPNRISGRWLVVDIGNYQTLQQITNVVFGIKQMSWNGRMEEPVELELQPKPIASSAATDSGRWPWTVLILATVAQFMVIIDPTVVTVALPSIRKAFRFASPPDLQWLHTPYVLVTAALTLLGR